MTKNSLLKSVSILFFATIVAKVIGAVYRIPLTWILGAEGLGIYQLVFPIFSLLLVVSSTGTPTVLSTMISQRLASGQTKNAKQVFVVGFWFLLILGICAFLLLCCLGVPLSNIQDKPELFWCYVCIGLAIPFVSILSAFRGYFQGHLNMVPTALSQVVEQFSKLVFGLLLSYFFAKQSVLLGALGAIFGVVASEIVAVFVMIVYYFLKLKTQDYASNYSQNQKIEQKQQIFVEFLKNATPIVLCSFLIPMLQVVDSVVVVPMLKISGVSTSYATSLWGISSGVVNSLINLPTTLTLSVATSIAPFLRRNLEDQQQIQTKIKDAYKLTFNIAFPCAVMLFALAGVVLGFLYGNGGLDFDLLVVAEQLLMLNAPFLILISFVQVQNAVLQGLGKLKIPLLFMLVASVAKVGLLWLCSINTINIFGVSISNIAFYFVAFTLNTLYISKKVNLKINKKSLLPCVVSGTVMFLFLIVSGIALKNINIYARLVLLVAVGGSTYFSTFLLFVKTGVLKNYFSKLKNFVYKRKKL